MEAEGIHKSDIGTRFVVTVLQEGVAFNFTAIGGGTVATKQILLKQPDGTVLAKTASYVSDGSNGELLYVTLSGDLSVAGRWEVQAYIVIAGGTSPGSWHTDKVEFLVLDNVD